MKGTQEPPGCKASRAQAEAPGSPRAKMGTHPAGPRLSRPQTSVSQHTQQVQCLGNEGPDAGPQDVPAFLLARQGVWSFEENGERRLSLTPEDTVWGQGGQELGVWLWVALCPGRVLSPPAPSQHQSYAQPPSCCPRELSTGSDHLSLGGLW